MLLSLRESRNETYKAFQVIRFTFCLVFMDVPYKQINLQYSVAAQIKNAVSEKLLFFSIIFGITKKSRGSRGPPTTWETKVKSKVKKDFKVLNIPSTTIQYRASQRRSISRHDPKLNGKGAERRKRYFGTPRNENDNNERPTIFYDFLHGIRDRERHNSINKLSK